MAVPMETHYTCVVMVMMMMMSQAQSMSITDSYRVMKDTKNFQYIVRDQESGDIYIGAINSLFHLDPHLGLISMETTGPQLDNVNCPPPDQACVEKKSLANSFSRGVAIDNQRQKLIACFTLFQGFCEIRNLQNISVIEKTVYAPIVPNSPVKSSLLFTAPSTEYGASLYVGATFSNFGSKLSEVPHISSRRLSDLDLSYRDQDGSSSKEILSSHRHDMEVNFVYGFPYNGFIYFIVTQATEASEFVHETKIVRICSADKYFRSYVEIKLVCHQKFTYAKAAHVDDTSGQLFVIFQDGERYQSGPSGLCRYNMADVEQSFNLTVKECYEGDGMLGPSHIQQQEPCERTISPPDYCGQSEISRNYSAILGRNPIFQRPLVNYDDVTLTAVTAIRKEKIDIVLLGTSDGQVKKVLVSPGNQVQEVGSMEVDGGQPINKHMIFNSDHSKIYIMSTKKISLVNTDHCEEKTTCDECNASPDPLCGWCVMTDRCTESSACPQSAAVVPRWLPSKGQVCAQLGNITPHQISSESVERNHNRHKVSFTLEEIAIDATFASELKCKFTGHQAQALTSGSIQSQEVTCPLPPNENLPVIPHDNTPIVVEFQVGGKKIAKRSIVLFDCRQNENCTACTESNFSCVWQVDTSTCTKLSSTATTPNRIVQHSGVCPMIAVPLRDSTRDSDVRIHSGETKLISVRALNLMAGQEQNLKCKFEMLGKVREVPAQIISKDITCEKIQFSYAEDKAFLSVKFQVTWGNNDYPLDNPRNIQVQVYKCAQMVNNCGQCLTMDHEYECGWCGQTCSLQKDCSTTWLDRSSTCPDPKIFRFTPLSGPIKGKTNVTVNGNNLGKVVSDLQVKVAGVNCRVLPEHFEPSVGFRCETDEITDFNVGNIIIKVDDTYTAESDNYFAFVDPQVGKFRPLAGPESGGTRLTIKGKFLDAGSKVTVDVGGSPCSVEDRTNDTMICMTSALVSANRDVPVQVNFGGYERLLLEKFVYDLDPLITAIEPKESILSGGIAVTILGERLGLIQRPELFMINNGQEHASPCFHLDEYRLLCRTPQLSFPGENITSSSPKEVHFGLNLDLVMTFRNLSKKENIGPFFYYPDPVINDFPGSDNSIKYKAAEPLVLQGSFKSVESKKMMRDLQVIVGMSECQNIQATDTALTCEPPPKPDGLNNDGTANVQIKIGNLRQDLGYLTYFEPQTKDKPIAMGVILGVVLPIVVIIALLAICIIRRQRKNAPDKNSIPDMLKDYDGGAEEKGIGINSLSVKADMNGHIPETIQEDSGPYVAELLSRVDDESEKEAIRATLIPRSNLELGELVGKGVFGSTYQGRYRPVSEAADNTTCVEVAAKALTGCTCSDVEIDAYLKSCPVLMHLQHPNILSLHGLCLSASEVYLVMPFMERGDVKTYVRDPSKDLKAVDLLTMAQQIAGGMSYLEDNHVVHGNLAARNCLLCENMAVKVAGFGVTPLYSKDFFKSDEDKVKAQKKWVAPEALENNDYSHKTDVWSFGIVLWELLTRGVTPYPDVQSDDLKKYLEEGHRLKKPRQCPETIYLMMLQCWTDKVSDRPTFQEIHDDLANFLSAGGDHGMDEATEEEEKQPLQSNIQPGGSTEYLGVTKG